MVLILVVLRSELQEHGTDSVVALGEKRLNTPFEDQHRRPAAQDERKRKNGALAKDSSHQACQALTLFQLEKVNCARGFEEKPSTELQGTTERSSGSPRARTIE